MNDKQEQVINADSVAKLTLQLQCAVQFEEATRAIIDDPQSAPLQRVIAKAALDLNHASRGILRGVIDLHNQLAVLESEAVDVADFRLKLEMLAHATYGYYQDSLAQYLVQFDMERRALLIEMVDPNQPKPEAPRSELN